MNDWDWTGCDDDFGYWTPDNTCKHEWVAVELIRTTKWHCKKCGVKREDVEKE